MIELKEVLTIHHVLIEKFGGGNGVRDITLLESALARPFSTFDGNELYPTAIEKAAALIESILINHPFVDGNKRTGYVLMRLLLMKENSDIKATQDEKYNFVIDITTGKLHIDEIIEWLKERLISI